MHELTLSDLQRFHADLLTIRSAGVELEFQGAPAGSSSIDTSTVETLRSSLLQIEDNLAAAKARGASVESLIEASDSLPPQYLTALRSWEFTGQLPLSFEPVVAMSDEAHRCRGAHRVSIVQPISWMLIGYFALLSICFVTANSFLRLTEDMRMEPGPILSAVLLVRDWMPVWIWVAPLAILSGTWMIWNRKPSCGSNRLRGRNFVGSAETLRRANLAKQTADLIQQGVAPNQAINMLGIGGIGAVDKTQLPPLLQWAANTPRTNSATDAVELDDTRARMLLASGIYRGIASVAALQQQKLARTRIPYVLLGGILVLCISLCVFGPLIELLYSLAKANGG